MLSAGHPATSAISLEASEAPIVFSVGEHLKGEDSEAKAEIISGLLSGNGEFRGLPCRFYTQTLVNSADGLTVI